ncbi:alpha-(1,3)-fucosyltransferase C-like [Mya arenaria]|uniref:alpha-(1,3)-fucosyltransferase C-like n=1 Tax=Mya arenaria TaxID=6604 RepID=UPI0022E7FE54|nr:alpha-(1,3)-fucosyltransferase C-like [Mya arenaria]
MNLAIMFRLRRRSNRPILYLAATILLFIVYRIWLKHNFLQYPGDQLNRNFTKYITKYEKNYWEKADTKKILFWTPFFGSWGWMEDAQKQLPQCPVSCTATSDKSTLTDADAVMFHTNDFWKYKGFLATIKNVDIELPKLRTPNQVWALFSWEPMIYHWGNIPPNIMNWTMLYRRESSIYMPFTSYYKMTQKEITQESTKAKETTNYFQEKTKFATTMVSNCNDQARRYRIIDELQQYIDLDYFGKCSGKIICKAGVPTTECGEMNFKKYKFYLAFENSFCRDYVSEKFWNALDRRQIPVIAAPKYNLEMLPPNSYLNVFDFPSIKAVAERMIEIGSNEALFNSFFEWTKFYKKDNTSIYCKLCKELHANRPAQSYSDMEGWVRDDVCFKSSPWLLATTFIDRLLFTIGL